MYAFGVIGIFVTILRGTRQKRDSGRMEACFGLLYMKYKPEYHYWFVLYLKARLLHHSDANVAELSHRELLLLGKRSLAVVIASSTREALVAFQMILFTLVVFVYLSLCLYFRPFVSETALNFTGASMILEFTIAFSGM